LKRLLPVPITAEFEEKLLAEISHETLRAELRAALQPAYSGPGGQARKVWHDSIVELACKVRDDWEASRKVKAKTLNAALEQACARWVRPDGRQFSAKSLRELLRKRTSKINGDPL
jgi:hypothetical protein